MDRALPVSDTDTMKLSIVIVTFNDKDLVCECLETLFAGPTTSRFQVIVVDNGSSDGTAEHLRRSYPIVEVIQNRSNLGYAVSNNMGIIRAVAPYILLLNPDARVSPPTIDELVWHMGAHPNVGIMGPKLIRPNGDLDAACRRQFPTPRDYLFHFILRGVPLGKLFPQSETIARYHVTSSDPDEERDVGAIAGAFLLFRREVLDTVGYLDEQFFIFGEDLDFCFRAVLSGWKVRYCPSVTVLHLKNGTCRHYRQRMTFHYYRSNLLLYRKHLAPNQPPLLNHLIHAGVVARLALALTWNALVSWRG